MADEKENKASTFIASGNNIVPKFCTGITFSGLQSETGSKAQMIVMSFLYGEGDQSFLIERILIEKEHAQKMMEALKDVIGKMQNA